MKMTPKGTHIAEIGLAVNRTFTTESGEKREEVTFVDVTLWGRVAEIVGEYCKKGRPLFVEGRLQLDSWDDKQTGQKRSRLGVVLESFSFIDSKPGDQGGAPAPARASRPAQPAAPESSGSDVEVPAPSEDDVPF